MRSFLIAIGLFLVCGCSSTQHPDLRPSVFRTSALYLDLRHPVYMLADKSLWLGCDKDPAGDDICRALRVKQINEGVQQWFDYFDKADRPEVAIFFSEEELPSNPKNRVIHLGIDPGGECGKEKLGGSYVACYRHKIPEIVFDGSSRITPRIMAHEFGHALGRDDNDVPEGTGSVMSYKTPTNVLPLDIEIMCRLHFECRMVK
ncbi:MAG: hypothetical protein G01um101413_738 [Parcubacteria group bacterium Gr01-1014_13]|nr:MAG: hypothetical protein G01um101413_738 [Parcubacteria group bacterium Gr01-1014_13]